jgi:hypothetical protein
LIFGQSRHFPSHGKFRDQQEDGMRGIIAIALTRLDHPYAGHCVESTNDDRHSLDDHGGIPDAKDKKPDGASTADRNHLDHSLFRTETTTAKTMFTALILTDDDFVAALMLNYFEHSFGTSDERRANFDSCIACKEQHWHFDHRADFGLIAVNSEAITGRSTVLMAAILDDGVHVKLLKRSAMRD